MRLRKLIPSEELSRRLKDAADKLRQVIEETVKQLKDVDVVDLQFEAGDIALRVVAGNGTHDHWVAKDFLRVAPAWQPGAIDILAVAQR